MSTSTQASAQPGAHDDQRVPDYTAEIRFGVVMYGGVSLAIYINGVTSELFEMACATPRDGVRIDDTTAPFTRNIYRRVSWLAGSADLRARYARAIRAAAAAVRAGQLADDCWGAVDRRDSTQTRLAIDAIAGTSAGGINGVFLAKALANGEQFGALKDLWVNEGDIALLLNDESSYSGTQPPIANRSDKPTSLLNSDRMYVKLQSALQQMAPLAGVSGPLERGESPLVDEVDLYVTTTDIKGSAVPLRLFDKVVYERRFKQSYHFSHPNGSTEPRGNDFAAVNVPFLAFASRCTSSFPFAFEPMTLDALTRMRVAGDAPGVLRWNDFFPNLPRDEVAAGRHVYRAFGDGGYLDNKPFTYVVETLSRRFASVPLERKLLFVEPSPKNLRPDDPDVMPDERHPPDAVENSLAALTTIPRYETIREDLQSVLTRNRRIERIERVVLLGERSLNDKAGDPFVGVVAHEGKVPAWSTLKLSDMVRYYGTAYLPYQRLRAYTVTDALADRLAARWSIDSDSDQLYALRALVRVWRERNFDDEGRDGRQTVNAFLDQFDFDYRIRRLGFLLRKVDKMIRLFHSRAAGELDRGPVAAGVPPSVSEEAEQLLDQLPAPFTGLGAELPLDQVRNGERVLRTLKAGLLECRERLLEAHRALGGGPSDDAEGPALRADLQIILGQILGDVTPGGPATVQARGQAGRTPVILKPEALRMASAMRTLQDAVLFRARALFDASERAAVTPIQQQLVAGVESMRVKRPVSPAGPDDLRRIEATEPELHAAATLAWRLLGAPELVVDRESNQVVVQVGAAAGDGLTRVGSASLALLNTSAGHALRRLLGVYYIRFDTYDQMSFPLYYDTGTGEPSTVEVVRVSPVDATNLIDEARDPQHRRKLAGTALANFGAFLDRRWRLNDIMWGRLDGVERLVQVLLPMTDDDTRLVRQELIERAQRSILKDALAPEGHGTLTELVVRALDETPSSGTTTEQLREMLAQLWTGDTVARDRLGGLLVSLLSESGLMDYVRNSRKVDAQPDPQATLQSAARAVTITGRVLESISKKHDAGKAVPRWIARLGLLLQGIVAVSLPGTLNQRWWTHGMKVLYAFEAVLVLLAFLFGNADMRTLSITALASTFGIHLLTLIAGDLMRERQHRIVYVAVMSVLGALIALAAVGTLALVHQGAQQQLCWTRPGDPVDGEASAWLCNKLGTAHTWWANHFKASANP